MGWQGVSSLFLLAREFPLWSKQTRTAIQPREYNNEYSVLVLIFGRTQQNEGGGEGHPFLLLSPGVLRISLERGWRSLCRKARPALLETALVSLCILEQLTSSFTIQRTFSPFMFYFLKFPEWCTVKLFT